MIAAGSLFTSCVTNTEPQGVKDLREAKADYLASLSKLREADAEKVKAEAAVEQAKAEVQKAIAAQNQALAEAQQILNEAARIDNEVAAAQAKAAIDTIKAKAERDAVKAQEALAKAQADLEKTLRDLAAASIGLTGAEKDTLASKTLALNTAYYNYNAWLGAYNGAVKDLWNAEYNIVAGVKGYETAESYKDSIAAQNDKIAKANEVIASLEALKEHPQAVKDSIDAIDAQIADLWKQLNLINSDKILYEATPGFVESKAAFAKRVETFKNDSLGGTTFKFVDKDEDGNDIPVEYDLTDGKGIDAKLSSIMRSFWKYKADDNYITLRDIGFEPAVDKDAIKVGLKPDYQEYEETDEEGNIRWWREITGYSPSSPEDLEKGLDILDEIVETLNRELVVVDNIKDSTTIEDAKKAAHFADSVFDAHYAILKAGLEEYAPYKDSVAKIDTLKAAKEDARVKDSIAGAKVAADEVAIKDALKAAAKDYIEANQAFVDAVNDIVDGRGIGSISKTDSTAFIKAVQNLGKAQAAYLGKTDSLVIVVEKDGKLVENNKVSIAELVASGFVEKTDAGHKLVNKVTSLYGGTGYGMFAGKTLYSCEENAWYSNSGDEYKGKTNAFSRVALAILKGTYETFAFSSPIKEDNVAIPCGSEWAKYDSKSPVAYSPVSDTVDFAKKYIKGETVVAEFATLKEDNEAKQKTLEAYNEAADALKNYKGVEKATVAYQTIYKSFWGITGNLDTETKKECVNPQKFTWTKKTFVEPSNCVEFWYNEYDGQLYIEVLGNSALQTILDNVDPDGYYGYYYKNADNHRIFRNENSNKLTEFAQALFKAQLVEDLGEYVPNKARLEKINAQVAQIREDVEAAIAEYEAATEGLDEVKARFYGVDEDGELIYFANPELTELFVNSEKGKWAFGGYLLEWAEELAPEYPAIVKAVNDKTPAIFAEIFILENYKKTLDLIFTIYFDFFEAQKEGQMGGNVEGILYSLNEAIKYQKNTVIAGCKVEIAKFEKLVAACEAGYSPADAVIASLKQTVETYKRYLAQAEEALARAQKEYDEAIAMYGVNE